MNKKTNISSAIRCWIGLILLAPVVLSGCHYINTGGEEGKGHMNFYLTDHPGEYEEVNVSIQSLKIHLGALMDSAGTDTTGIDTTGADTTGIDTTQTDSMGTDTTGGNGRWITLPVDPVKVNLLDFSEEDADTLLSSADLDPGHYTQLRLMLSDDNDVVVDGTTYPLTVPGGQQSGYKIKFNERLESGEGLDVTIDFDADKSVHKTGGGEYMLKPVLHATSRHTWHHK